MSLTDNGDIDSEDFEMSDSRETSLLLDSASGMADRSVKYLDSENEVVFEGTSTNADVREPEETKTSGFLYVLSFFAAIGGFLFGYDTGVVSGAMLLLKERFNLTSLYEEIIVSATILFAAIFALVGGFMNDFLGRKFTTICASAVFTGGAVILGFAKNIAMLVIGRSILGIGIGLASMTVPIYIAECAPPQMRGRLVTLNNLFITGGQFIASVVDGGFSYDKTNGWRWMLGLAGIPSAIQFIGFLFLPESPRWLVKKKRIQDATKVLQFIRGSQNVEREIKSIQQSCEQDEEVGRVHGDQFVLVKIFKNRAVRKAVIVGCGLQLFQQLSGINTVMYYSASIVKMTGIRDETTAIWIAAGTAGVNFVFTLVGLWLVERIGRRPLILGSLFGVLISLVVLAVGFQLMAFNSPPVSDHTNHSSVSPCLSYNWCEGCIEDKNCGYCYTEVGKSAVNGSCLPIMTDDSSQALFGQCNSTSLPPDTVWAYGYCPTDYSWMGILGLVLYLMFFAPGMGPMPWTINSEIYPLWARSAGGSLATATNWIFNLVVSMSFLTLTETLTKYGTYWLFVGIVFLGLVFMFFTVPETRGKHLEEVEELFEEPWCSRCSGESGKITVRE
ncbi:proton myo-inositol cotransporter-like [Ylistrum balloti]|uniref:proton myo-inositol cotransporter-like n=1 Tax=Ylistrum balloti TaxID=509963 RepID=UPI002905F162|nr:proton myo-inositol cotransporter-like [Ylistrum balloti]